MEKNFNDGRLSLNNIIVDTISPRTDQQAAFLSYVSNKDNSLTIQVLLARLEFKNLIITFLPKTNSDNKVNIVLNFNEKTLSEEQENEIKVKINQLTSSIIQKMQEHTPEVAAPEFEINYGTSFDVNIESIERATLKPSRRFYK
jgi:hypothetical protein